MKNQNSPLTPPLLAPPSRIGVMGGGQLGKMLAQPAKQMGYKVSVFDPNHKPPAAQVCDTHFEAPYSDHEALTAFAQDIDVVTYEFEHIPIDALKHLESLGKLIVPSIQTLEIIQNKFTQKTHFEDHNLPVAPFKRIDTPNELTEFYQNNGQICMVKPCYGGYDGKGTFVVRSPEDAEKVFELYKDEPLYVESFVNFTAELSVMVAKSGANTVVYPVSENKHDEGILIESIVPAQITQEIAANAMKVAQNAVSSFSDNGLFCVELFLTTDHELVINEIAPRAHNTGHYTIEACETSQYEQWLRILTGMPLGATTLPNPVVMYNLLGPDTFEGPYRVEGMADTLALEGCNVHIYGKPFSANRKKLGHLTTTAATIEEALNKTAKAVDYLQFVTL